MRAAYTQAQHRVEPDTRSGLYQFVFLHHTLMLFARAFGPILIVAATRRKLLNDFVQVIGRIAIWIAAGY
jgi:hypothetical protein